MDIREVKFYLSYSPFLYAISRGFYSFLKKNKERFFSLVFRLFPVKSNKVVINNYRGKGYGDNAKYIANKFLNNNKFYDLVWILKDEREDKTEFSNKIRIVKYNSIRSIFELTTAKIWIFNNRVEFCIYKRKKQFYIQTWHGGLGLKKIEGDAPYGIDKKYIKRAKNDSNMADVFISNSGHLSDIYKRAFWYDGNILEYGYPKNDILFLDNALYRSNIRKKYNLNRNVKVLLYAPTFRKGHDVSAYDLNVSYLLNTLNSRLKSKEKWVFMARLHPNIDKKIFNSIFPMCAINATQFPDMQELVKGVDILVTDYSSCMFDAAMAKIPTFIYASDISSYMDNRGFYFTLEELPFSVSENTQDLISNMLAFKEKEYQAALDEFYKRVRLYDMGDAGDKVFNALNEIIYN